MYEYDKEINIKFIKISKNIPDKIQNTELIGLLKLCFLKEISSKISAEDLKQLPDLTQYIMTLLKKGYIKDFEINIKETIKKVLERMQGSNIINFSDFVDDVITTKQINEMLNLLNSEYSKEIINIRNSLSKYNLYIEIFNKDFERSKKESIFEFSIISLVIMEREDF